VNLIPKFYGNSATFGTRSYPPYRAFGQLDADTSLLKLIARIIAFLL